MTNKNYYQRLPKKQIGAGVLLFNKNNELLIVKPSYRNYWSIPGGVVEKNETPKNGCIREIQEEIGLSISKLQFLSVNYIFDNEKKGESLLFIFYGGTLSNKQIASIQIDKKEIIEYKFLKIKHALSLLDKIMKDSISKSLKALKNKTALYLENSS